MEAFFMFLLGFVAGQLPGIMDRRRRVLGQLQALRGEVVLCQVQTTQFLAPPHYKSPLYRLPVSAFEKVLHALLVDGIFVEEEVIKLGRFAGVVQEFNRGLDEAAEHRSAGKSEKLDEAFGRNLGKAERLANGKDGEGALAPAALEILSQKIARGWLIA